ncbi:HNH endonuclease signature motif containing protein [Magnetococcus sp. PR-3]|uniref:HNH endonuclease signature motif containing protein n=1 Tax=Magnetococcus sp. PR-3 TaxID=3120355 RepID=UPI003FA5C910
MFHLSREPLCRICKRKGKTERATVVDHMDGDATNNDSGNLQSLCASCHSRKTAKQDGGFGNSVMGRGVKIPTT